MVFFPSVPASRLTKQSQIQFLLFRAMEFSDGYQPRVASDSKIMVRNFTETLDGSSVLAIRTKEAQAEIDVKMEKRERLRREHLFRDLNNASE